MPSMITRRDVLEAFLGAPFAFAACTRSSGRAIPDGELVFRSEEVGHRLWSRQDLAVSNGAYVPVAIVGGGAAGLSAAWHLTRSGFTDFELFEVEKTVGGHARAGNSAVTRFPWGAHYITAPMAGNRALRVLLSELDGWDVVPTQVAPEAFLCRDPEERLFYRGAWQEGLYLSSGASERDRAELERFQVTIARLSRQVDGKGRRPFVLPRAMSSTDAEFLALDKLTMSEWLRKNRFHSERLWWIVDYACRDDYGLRVEHTSAWAALFYFAARQSDGSDDAYQPVVTWPEGNERLIRHMASSCANKLISDRLVLRIRPSLMPIESLSPNAKKRLDLIMTDRDGSVQGVTCEQVIFCAPTFLRKFVIETERTAPPEYLSSFQSSSWMVANLHLSRRPQEHGFPLAWDNVLYESPSLGYVVATHQSGQDYGPTVWTYYYPLAGGDPKADRARLLATDRRAWADVAMSDLGRAHPDLSQCVERIDVVRWGHAMVRPVPGLFSTNVLAEAALPHDGIHYAHSDLSGLPLFEEAFYQGVRAAEEVMTTRGHMFRSLLT